MDLYAENILDHYRHPRNKGQLPNANCHHAEVNPACGDELTLRLLIKDSIIEDLGWDGTGCAISQAAMSMLAEELPGMSPKDAETLSAKDVHDLLGVPIGPRRVKCALLALHTLKNTLRKVRGQGPQGWLETIGTEEKVEIPSLAQLH